MKRILNTVILSLSVLLSYAAQTPMGQWRTHMAFANIDKIAQTENKIYGLSTGSLFSIDKLDFTVELHSKLSGLSDTEVSLIAYSEYDKLLMVVYKNSNIDLISNDYEITNVSDIYRKTFNGDKTINHIEFTDGYAYLSTGFGIVVINMDKFEIADTYTIGSNGNQENVINVGIANDDIYALSENNLKHAPMKGVNLSNYNNWQTITTPAPSVVNKQILAVKDTLYLVKTDNKLYRYVNGVWSDPTSNVSSVKYDNGILFTRSADNVTTAPGMPAVSLANDITFDTDNNALWHSTSSNVTRINLDDNSLSYYAPNGPATNDSWEFAYCDDRIFVVPGGKDAVQYSRPATLSIFDNGQWTNIWTAQFNTMLQHFSATDIVDIEVDPNDKTHFFAASYGDGLYEFRNNNLYKLYNRDNRGSDGKGIETVFENGSLSAQYKYQRVDALQFDNNGNLWMHNASLVCNIKMLDKNGKFHYLPYSEMIIAEGVPNIERILISSHNPNIKFVGAPRYQSTVTSVVFVFDDKGTIDNVSDDQTRLFTSFTDQDGKDYPLSQHLWRSMAQDKNGVIWIGTTEGILLLNDIDNIFNSNFRCQKIKIPRDDGTGLADYLLETEQINDITVDGANRKWIATKNSGLYLVSEDGLSTIHHFTEDNSPILSNNIISLEINDKTGELFIGTGKGIISYQSDSNEGGDSFENVHAFPNPVRPEFTGTITITGLTDGSSVRITDVNGNMVYDTRSYGGYATWDGCRANGQRVATGIYFAHCVSEDRKDKAIVKIMVIN